MKYYRNLFLTLFVFSSNVYAYQPKIEIFEQFDNLRMVAFIEEKDINNSPEWTPGLSPIPLTVSGAIQAVAKLTKASNAPDAIKEIEIRPVPNFEKHWHYLIKVDNEAMNSKYNIYVVLMNGKVIPAIIEPQGYK